MLVSRSLGGLLAVLIVVAGCSREAPTVPAPVVSQAKPAAGTTFDISGAVVAGDRHLGAGASVANSDCRAGAAQRCCSSAVFTATRLKGLLDLPTARCLRRRRPGRRRYLDRPGTPTRRSRAVRRENANGVDINRNFPAKNFDGAGPAGGGEPLSQPESRAVVDAIDGTSPDLVIVLHSWEGREFINFDGPARPIAEQFSRVQRIAGHRLGRVRPTPGSLGSYIGRDRGIPLLTVELRRVPTRRPTGNGFAAPYWKRSAVNDGSARPIDGVGAGVVLEYHRDLTGRPSTTALQEKVAPLRTAGFLPSLHDPLTDCAP